MTAVRILSDDVIKNLLQHIEPHEVTSILSSLNNAFKQYTMPSSSGEAESQYQPERAAVTRANGQKTLFMPATSREYIGAKIVGIPPPTAAGKTLTGVLVLCDAEGKPVGFLNSQEFTAFRTALGSMSLLRYRRRAENIVVFGASKQAFWHIRLALLLRPLGEIKRITVMNRSSDRAGDLIQKLRPFIADEVCVVGSDPELKQIVQDADVIFCTTPAKIPLFSHKFLEHTIGEESGPYIAAIGSYHESMSELDPILLAKITSPDEDGGRRIDSHIFVDSKSGCLQEAGEIIQAKLDSENLGEIGQALHYLEQDLKEEEFEQYDGFVHKWVESGLLVYKSVGMGVMDLAVGGALLELASLKRVGDVATI